LRACVSDRGFVEALFYEVKKATAESTTEKCPEAERSSLLDYFAGTL